MNTNVIFSRFLWLHLALFCIGAGMYAASGFNPTASSALFDGYLVCLLVLAVFQKGVQFRKFTAFGLATLALLILYSLAQFLIYGLLSEKFFLYEFLRSSRFLFYLILFVLIGEYNYCWGGNWKMSNLASTAVAMGLLFFAAYLVLFLTGNPRPALYSENNYEVPSLFLFFAIASFCGSYSRSGPVVLALSGLVAFLSKSKSGVIEFVIFVLRGGMMRFRVQYLPLYLIVMLLSLFVFYSVFSERMDGVAVDKLDRSRFAIDFYNIMVESSWLEILFGHGIAAALPFETCRAFKFWAETMSSSYEFCNAVIFHSFFMRLAYDAGITGCIIFTVAWYKLLARYYGGRLGLTLFLIAAACSLSVSGFSNSIVIWPMFAGLFFQQEIRAAIDKQRNERFS